MRAQQSAALKVIDQHKSITETLKTCSQSNINLYNGFPFNRRPILSELLWHLIGALFTQGAMTSTTFSLSESYSTRPAS